MSKNNNSFKIHTVTQNLRNHQKKPKRLFFHVFQNVLKYFYNNSPNAWMSTQNDENLREKYAPRHRGHRKIDFPKIDFVSYQL